ncbi:MAG: beta-lactamase family protein [Bacilli bacterium]|nr:beta-lactamase family protein [Bacilli bacterium]
MESKIDEILNNLLNTGSQIPYIKELREKSIDEIKKDIDLRDVLRSIADDIEIITRIFLEKKNEFNTSLITGISTGVYLPDYENDSRYKLKVVGGTISRNSNDEVNNDTLFDVASITKLYTLILTFKLEELGILDLNTPIKNINSDFQNLGDFTINDLIRLHGEFRTDGSIAAAESYEEAIERFKSMYLISNDRTRNKYNDFGAMVLADTIEKVVSEKLGRKMKYDEIINEFLFIPLYIKNTTFTPGIINISGNANDIGMPHDPKSRNLGGITGHAGLFTSSEGLIDLSEGLFNSEYLDKDHIARLGEITFEGSSKGNLGVYLKHPDGWSSTYNPPEFSDGSFSHQGWTGSVASFDPNNMIHNNILVNAIELNPDKSKLKNDKPLGFKEGFGLYQSELIKRIMLMYVVKKYYNKYCHIHENINEDRKIL